jgi:hypothetical protein
MSKMSTSEPTKLNGPADAHDLSELWIDTGLGDPLTTEYVHSVPIGRPKEFFRVVKDPAYQRKAEIIRLKSENLIAEQYFLVAPAMQGRIDEARPCILVVTVDRTGRPRVWPLMLPRPGERDNGFWMSARVIARKGMDFWVKLKVEGSAYTEMRADMGYAPDPDFSRLQPFDELIHLGFGDHGIIRDEEHPVYRDLAGKALLSGDGNALL